MKDDFKRDDRYQDHDNLAVESYLKSLIERAIQETELPSESVIFKERGTRTSYRFPLKLAYGLALAGLMSALILTSYLKVLQNDEVLSSSKYVRNTETRLVVSKSDVKGSLSLEEYLECLLLEEGYDVDEDIEYPIEYSELSYLESYIYPLEIF